MVHRLVRLERDPSVVLDNYLKSERACIIIFQWKIRSSEKKYV